MTPRIWSEGAATTLPPTDRGFLWGQGLFETTRLWRGRAWLWEAHLDRLTASAGDLELPLPAGDWRARVSRALEEMGREVEFGRVRLTLTAGDAGPDGDPAAPPTGPPRLFLHVWPSAAPPDRSAIARLVPADPPVAGGRSGLGGHKTIARFDRLLALRRAMAAGGDEALQSTPDGRLVGASRANIFIVRDGELLTPSLDAGVLPGITRALVIATLAPALGMRVRETALAFPEVGAADGIFLTNSLWGVRPAVVGIGAARAAAHPVVGALAEAARRHLREAGGDAPGPGPGG